MRFILIATALVVGSLATGCAFTLTHAFDHPHEHTYQAVRADIDWMKDLSATNDAVGLKIVAYPAVAVDTVFSACLDTVAWPLDYYAMIDGRAKTNQSVETQK